MHGRAEAFAEGSIEVESPSLALDAPAHSLQDHMSAYREHAPPPELTDFVECFWTRDVPARTPAAGAVHRVLPDCCSDVIFSFDGSRVDASAVGTMTRPIVIDDVPALSFVGARFHPGKATALLGVPASELTDLSVPLDAIWADAGSAVSRFEDCATQRERVNVLAAVLRARLPSAVGATGSVDLALRHIVASAGNLSIGTLASVVGISRQHLAKRFAHDVGLSPKVFARVVRLRRVLERVRATADPDWSALALECGYYDQSHLIGDFREIAGVTPGEWVR